MQYDYKLITVLIKNVDVYVETICVDFKLGVDQFIRAKGVRLRQIIDLLTTEKSRYFAQPRPIIVLLFDYSFFFNFRKAKRSAIFTQERSQEGEKRGFICA